MGAVSPERRGTAILVAPDVWSCRTGPTRQACELGGLLLCLD